MDLTTLKGVQNLVDTTPLHRWLGFKVTAMDVAAGTLSITAPTNGNAERFEGAGQSHGGAVATLVDSTATFACSVALGRPVPTMNIRVDYLKPAGGNTMTATATVRRSGRTVAVVDVEVLVNGQLVALGRCGQSTAA